MNCIRSAVGFFALISLWARPASARPSYPTDAAMQRPAFTTVNPSGTWKTSGKFFGQPALGTLEITVKDNRVLLASRPVLGDQPGGRGAGFAEGNKLYLAYGCEPSTEPYRPYSLAVYRASNGKLEAITVGGANTQSSESGEAKAGLMPNVDGTVELPFKANNRPDDKYNHGMLSITRRLTHFELSSKLMTYAVGAGLYDGDRAIAVRIVALTNWKSCARFGVGVYTIEGDRAKGHVLSFATTQGERPALIAVEEETLSRPGAAVAEAPLPLPADAPKAAAAEVPLPPPVDAPQPPGPITLAAMNHTIRPAADGSSWVATVVNINGRKTDVLKRTTTGPALTLSFTPIADNERCDYQPYIARGMKLALLNTYTGLLLNEFGAISVSSTRSLLFGCLHGPRFGYRKALLSIDVDADLNRPDVLAAVHALFKGFFPSK